MSDFLIVALIFTGIVAVLYLWLRRLDAKEHARFMASQAEVRAAAYAARAQRLEALHKPVFTAPSPTIMSSERRAAYLAAQAEKDRALAERRRREQGPAPTEPTLSSFDYNTWQPTYHTRAPDNDPPTAPRSSLSGGGGSFDGGGSSGDWSSSSSSSSSSDSSSSSSSSDSGSSSSSSSSD